MDVGYYISELLGLHGDVNVPGLGYFAHTRVNGYYNERENKFYPPGFSVQFDPQFLDDDDALAVHIAEKKKISVASSKYFTEKFVGGLKQQAALGEAPLADLGWFTANHAQLSFRPSAVTGNDPEFFGYPAIPLSRLGSTPPPQPEPAYRTEPVAPAPIPEPEYQSLAQSQHLTEEQFEVAQEQEEYLIELTSQRRRKTTWIFVVLALLFAALIAFLVKRYDPSAFNFSTGSKNKEKVTNEEPKVIEPKIVVDADTAAKKANNDSIPPPVNNVSADSAGIAGTKVKDMAAITRFEVIAGKYKTMQDASNAIVAFKAAGLDKAKLVTDAGGTLYKVSVGTFITRGQAEDNKNELVSSKKINAKDADVIQINPK